MLTAKEASRPLRVVVAEDDELEREALEHALADEGLEVVALEDGSELTDYVSARLDRWADVIVTDVNMPGRSGLDGLELARRRGLTQPLIVVSAERGPELRERVARLGNALFFPKPFDLDHLARAIRDLAELWRDGG